jgi:hypothetical protein
MIEHDMLNDASVPCTLFRIGNLQLEICEMKSPFREDDPIYGATDEEIVGTPDDENPSYRTLRIVRSVNWEDSWDDDLSEVIAFWNPCNPDFPSKHHLVLPHGKALNTGEHDIDLFLELCSYGQNLLNGWCAIRGVL